MWSFLTDGSLGPQSRCARTLEVERAGRAMIKTVGQENFPRIICESLKVASPVNAN